MMAEVLFSTSREAAMNHAMEEWLMEGVEPDREILFLYENEPTVVIGRFQNPWRECRTGLVRRSAAVLQRRISGGGTVVHVPGNLNFAIIAGRSVPDGNGNLDRVIRALGAVGLKVSRNTRRDLLIRGDGGDDLKVSGSAFRQIRGRSLHHATLLVNANLSLVRELLHHHPERDMEAKGVSSRPSPVANLASQLPGITMDAVIRAMALEWGGEVPRLSRPETEGKVAQYHRRLTSSEWIWGQTPDFRERFSALPGSGVVEVQVSKGRIAGIFFPDSGIQASHRRRWIDSLVGVDYQGFAILRAAGRSAPPWMRALADRVDGDAPILGENRSELDPSPADS